MSYYKALINNKISKGAAGTLFLNLCNQAFIFLTLVLLARMLNPAEFGLYSVILSTMTLIALPFLGGLTTFVMRHVAMYKAQKQLNDLKGVMIYAFKWIFIGTTIFIIISYFIFSHINESHNWGLPIIFLMPVLLFLGAILRGLKNVVKGRFAEFFLQPFLFLLFCLVAFFMNVKIDVDDVLQLYSLRLVLGLALSAYFVIKHMPKEIIKEKASNKSKEWLISALPLILSVGLIVANMNIDIVMVGSIAGEEQAGQYRVASRMAGFVLFVLFALNNSIAPRISSLYALGEKDKLQKIITKASRVCMILTLPVFLILIIFSKQILSVAFGQLFITASLSLFILSYANIFSVAMGQVGQVLSLTGFGKYAAYAVVIAVPVNIGLNALLVPQMGINGAAFATACSIIIWNSLLAYWSIRKTGLYCTALGPLGKRAI